MKSLLAYIVLTLSLSGDLSGQKSHHVPMSSTARECHQLLTGLKTQNLAQLNIKEILDALKKLNDCATGSSSQLSKKDLSNAVSLSYSLSLTYMTQVQDNLIQTGDYIFQLQTKVDQLTKASAVATDELQVTIETLPANYVRILTAGGYQRTCRADGPESMKCGEDTFTAMIARVKGTSGSMAYLIGCPDSYNCIPLVPGEFSAKMSGNDGLIISGIVREGETTGASRHGIYTILSHN